MKKIYVLAIIALFLPSCKNSHKELPESVGKIGSLTVVANTEVAQSVSEELNLMFLRSDDQFTGGAPFSELLKPNPKEFYQFFSNQRTVLALVTNTSRSEMDELLQGFTSENIDTYIQDEQATPHIRENVFAKNQKVIFLFAKDNEELASKLRKAGKQLKQLLVDSEIRALHDELYADTSATSNWNKEMKAELGLGFSVPKGFSLVEHRNGFWWFEKEIGTGSNAGKLGLVAHAYDMKDSSADFAYSAICAKRDSVMKYHIKGEIKGTYMGTSESDQYPARHRDLVTLAGMPGMRIRGWWNIDGIMMSGPFIRYVFRVPDTNRLFAFEGFVYKPDFIAEDKDIRQIESIALSIH